MDRCESQSGTMKIRNRRNKLPAVNSGWHLIIDPEYGAVWAGRGGIGDAVFVRRILFSRRKLHKRSKKALRFMKVGWEARYWEEEWGVTRHISSQMKNARFKKLLEGGDSVPRKVLV